MVQDCFNSIQENQTNFLSYSQIIIPIITFILGLFTNFIFIVLNDRRRRKRVKEHLLFSIDSLVTSTNTQANYIEEYNKQLKESENSISPHLIDPNFSLENIDAITIEDIFWVFLKEKKTETYRKLTTAIVLMRNFLNNFEQDKISFFTDTSMYFKQFNEFFDKSIVALNNYIAEIEKGKITEKEKNFTLQAKKLFEKMQNDEMNGNIFFKMEAFFIPVGKLAKKYNIRYFIEIIPKVNAIFVQFGKLREDFHAIFGNYIKDLRNANKILKEVKNELS